MPEFNYTRVIEGGGELWVCFASLIHRFNILPSILIEFQVGARSKLEFVWSTDFASWTVLLLFIQNNLVFLWERQWETIPNKSSVSQLANLSAFDFAIERGSREEELNGYRE